MRYLLGFMCVLAFGVMGCSETGGDGGSGGTTGQEFPCTEQGIRDAIAEGGGPHTFDCDGPTTVVTEAEIDLDNDVILDGEGNLTVDGNDSHTVLSVVEGVTAEIAGLVVTGGSSDPESDVTDRAAGIYNAGSLTLANSTVSGNDAKDGSVVANAGTLNMMGVTVSDNTQVRRAILNRLPMPEPTVPVSGGDDIFEPLPTLTMTNTTVSGNFGSIAGALENWGTLRMNHCTVSSPDEFGEGIAIDTHSGGVWFVANSIIDGICLGSSGFAVVGSFGGNIESPEDSCGFTGWNDQVNVTPEQLNLGPLQDNSGPTETHALLTEPLVSVAIEAADCGVDVDQRGVPRPQGILADDPLVEQVGYQCDAGAFELEQQDEACLFSGQRCFSGLLDPIQEMCEITVPDQPKACDGTESLENPTSCTPSGSSVTHKLTKMQVASDCNMGYDLDACAGRSCRAGPLAPFDGESGVDNGLGASAVVWLGAGLNLGELDQAFHDAICAGTMDVEIEADEVPEEGCAVVAVSASGVQGDPVPMNLSEDGCLSGTLGTIPVRIGDVDGSIENAVVRMTLSSQGFSDGILGGTADLFTAQAIGEVLIDGGSAVVSQLFDVNADLSGDWQAECDAQSMTLEIGGSAIP